MALENENGSNMVMPVAPMYGGNGMNNGGFGFGGDGLWFLVLFFLLCGNGGWGGFGGWGMGGFAADGAALYPWMNQSNQINNGFRDQMINDNVTSIRDGIHGLSTQLCNCCGDMQLGIAGVNQNICSTGNGIINAVNSGFNNAETANNARQIANMQQAFAAQTAMNQGFNALATQSADCCCKTQTGIQDLKYVVATENCADRTAAYQNTRDIIDSQTRGTQAILDKLCALELDGVKNQLAQAQRENIGLQNQVNMAAFEKSQIAQNALIQNGFNQEIDGLYNRLSSCPIPTVPVYGRQNIFQCNNNGCGCGCGNM